MSKQKAGHPGMEVTDAQKGAAFNEEHPVNEPLTAAERQNNKKRKKNQ